MGDEILLTDHLQQINLVLLFGGLTLLLLAESVWPRFARNEPGRLGHVSNNLGIWLLGALLFFASLSGFAPVAIGLVEHHGLGLVPLLGIPMWAAAVIGFLVADFADYVLHRLNHRWRPLWLLHVVHHSDPQMDVSTNLRAHPLSLVIGFGFRWLVIVMIGAPIWSLLLRDTVATFNSHLQHAAIAWPRGFVQWSERYLSPVFMVPTAHWYHHSPEPRHTDSNFGQVLSCWDRLFGTYISEQRPPSISGLDTLRASQWHTTWGMLLTPWRTRKQRFF